MEIALELTFIIAVIVFLYAVGSMHLCLINTKNLSLKTTLTIYTLFFTVHVFCTTLLHIYAGQLNPLPFWQYGVGPGGDEINFFNFLNFYHERFETGDFSYTIIDRHATDFSLWVYLLALLSHLIPVAEFSHFFVPKLLSSSFVSLVCVYTILFTRSLSKQFNFKLLLILLLVTPDFYHLAGGIFRAPMIAYCFILVLFLAHEMKESPRWLHLILFVPVFLFLLIWVIPKIKIFLSLLLVGLIFACLIYRAKILFFALGALAGFLLIFNLEFVFDTLEIFGDGFGLGYRILLEFEKGAAADSLAYSISQHSFLLLILINLLQFFISIPLWSTLIEGVYGDAESLLEFLVFCNNHIMMAFLIPGILDLKSYFKKNYIWILFPVLIYSVAMATFSTVLIRWRLPVMSLIVVVLSIGFKSRYKKLKVLYFIALSFLYSAYFLIKG